MPNPSGRSSTLIELPIEVLALISSHLTKRDGLRLALTCKSLQDVGESAVWRSLTLTDRQRPPTAESPTSPPPRIGEAQLHIGPSTPIAPSTTTAASPPPPGIPSTSQQIITHLLSLLRSRTSRAAAVRSLTIDLRHRLPSDVQLILYLTTGLEYLELRDMGLSFSTSLPLTAPLDLFQTLTEPLRSLRHLRLDIRYRWNETVVEIIDKVPNLETLHIYSHPRRIPGGVPPLRSRTIPRSTLSRLRELIVDEMEQSLVPTLAALIDGAHRLEAIALRDHAHRWSPLGGCPLLRALQDKPGLKKLECTQNVMPCLLQPGAFLDLEALMVLWGTDLIFADRKPDYLVPPLPNLQTYQLDISLHAASSDMDYHRSMLILPEVARDLLSSIRRQIHTCPSLATVYFPAHLDFISRREIVCPPPPDPIRDPDFCGMIIRSFVREPRDDEPLIKITHCRSKVTPEYPLLRMPMGRFTDCDSDSPAVAGWEDHVTLEDGSVMPIGILRAMCAVGGVDVDDVTQPRAMSLPERSWSLLRCWEMSL